MAQKQLSQFEVAVIALLSSIDCYKSENYVSSIILSGAARQVLNDLCISNQLPTTAELIGESTQKTTKQVHDFIAETYNSLKHADRNPGQQISVSEDEARMLIIAAASDLTRLNPQINENIKQIIYFAKSFQENSNGK